jgi:hypothetical protein
MADECGGADEDKTWIWKGEAAEVDSSLLVLAGCFSEGGWPKQIKRRVSVLGKAKARTARSYIFTD